MRWEISKKTRLTLVGIWLLLTLSLSAWWMVHGMQQTERYASFLPSPEIVERQHRMFFWEGIFLLSIITVGGMALFYSIYQDQKRNDELRKFFSTFTHELKTSLTSLRLQAEILEEDPRNAENENLRRLLRDVVRLELQLENALILAQADRSKLFSEELSLKKTIQALSVHWPQLKVEVEKEASIRADQRAFECIVKNLLQNAFVHGEARNFRVQPVQDGNGFRVLMQDDGKGFAGNPTELGLKLVRLTTRSGSGVGLYLSRILARRMGGALSFSHASPHGLQAELKIEGSLK